MNRIILFAFVAVGLVACGPGAKIGGGKQGAAEALYAASTPSKASADKTASPVDIGNISFNCPLGGSAQLVGVGVAIDLTGGGANVGQKLTIQFNSCGLAKADVGTAVYNGQMTFTQQVLTNAGTAAVNQVIKGKVSVQGAFDDFVDADVTQSLAVSALSGNATVSMSLKGTIATSAGSFTYDEMLTIIGGQITAQLATSK